jgi:lipopolysaccharide transport system permease protein
MSVPEHPEETVLLPPHGWEPLRLGELWRHRELLFFFVWRDLKVRYQQTLLGVAWAVIQPVATMLAFTIFFGKLSGLEARVGSDLPYPLFCLAGLTIFSIFSAGIQRSTDSVLANAHLVKKVYFPRLYLPIGAFGPVFVDFILGFVVLCLLCLGFGRYPVTQAIWLPLFVILALLVAFGVGIWFSSLCVQFHDVRHAVPFFLQIAMFSSPIAYPVTIVPEAWRWVYGLNPMVGVVEGFRWSLFGGDAPDVAPLVLSCIIGVVLTTTGLFFFRRQEQSFSDLV